jgi:8-oxo-dGTP diphosphatase
MGHAKRGDYCYEFPRPAVTVDVVLVSREAEPRVLLIKRKSDPFAGGWAIPGGFVEIDEALESAARRELKEETGVEAGELQQLGAFGDPGRDPRGRTISIVYIGRMDPAKVIPRAADDAIAVRWCPLNELPALAFDHAKVLARAAERIGPGSNGG